MLRYIDSRQPVRSELQEVSREAHYLDKLSRNHRLKLTSAGTVKRLPAETLILAEGSIIEEVSIILRGMVRTRLNDSSETPVNLYVSGPGPVVDSCALLDPPVAPISVRTLSDVEVLTIPRETFVRLVSREPTVGYEILQNLSRRLCLISEAAIKPLAGEYSGPFKN